MRIGTPCSPTSCQGRGTRSVDRPGSRSLIPNACYKPGGTLQNLECGVLTACERSDCDRPIGARHGGRWLPRLRRNWNAIRGTGTLNSRCAESRSGRAGPPRPKLFSRDCSAPASGYCPLASAAVSPERFNGQLDRLGNKATVLSTLTMELIKAVLPPSDGPATLVVCDNMAAASDTAALLRRVPGLPGRDLRGECRPAVRTVGGTRRGPGGIPFSLEKAERLLPVALASMMAQVPARTGHAAWNDFWQRQVPGLAPHSRLPLNAARFKKDIEACQQRLGISDRTVWRNR